MKHDNTKILHASRARASELLGNWLESVASDEIVNLVEVLCDAAEAQVFLQLEREGHRRRRTEALTMVKDGAQAFVLDQLGPEDLLSAALENGMAHGLEIRIGEQAAGSVELEEAAKFDNWLKRLSALSPPADCPPGQEPVLREALIHEIHADVAKRHPLGIACALYEVISAIGAASGEGDTHAIGVLDELILDETEAAVIEAIVESEPTGE